MPRGFFRFIFFLPRKKTNQKNAAGGEGLVREKANMPHFLALRHPLPSGPLSYFFRASKEQAIKPPSVAPATTREIFVLVSLSGKAISFARTRLCSQRGGKMGERLANFSTKFILSLSAYTFADKSYCFIRQMHQKPILPKAYLRSKSVSLPWAKVRLALWINLVVCPRQTGEGFQRERMLK